jgi:hypothetical protein
MKYLGNDRNIVRAATLTATNVIASQSYYRSDETEKAGGGLVELSGDYTGAADATYDIEIPASASSTPRASSPVLTGVGNGAMTGQTVSALAAQEITVTLANLGTRTLYAYSPFQGGVSLVARASGSGGNAISLTISRADLVATATDFATQGPITADQNAYAGDEWNFGGPSLLEDGTVPSTAPRLRFGVDPQIYRQYRKFDQGRYVYSFSPAPVRDVAAGTPVYLITGDYTVTIANGVTTEVLPDIETLYDCLAAINADSTLVRVDGVVAEDYLPGGQAVTELSIQTSPYLVADTREGTDHVLQADLGLTLDDDVPTEKLTIKCVDAGTPGSESWSVRGEVSRALSNAVTGEGYSAGGYAFTIPRVANPPGAALGTIHVQFKRPEQNDEFADPGFSAVQALLGANARSGRFVFIYKPRPVLDCAGTDTLIGGPSEDCLGITPPEDGAMSETSLLIRRQRLSQYVRTFVQTNTSSVASGSAASVDQDIAYINRTANILADCLSALDSASATLLPDPWVAATAYAVDAQVVGYVSGVPYRFAVTVAGTSHASVQPTWTGTLGATYTDNTVTWTNIGKAALPLWDELLALVQTDAAQITGLREQAVGAAQSWAATTAFVAGAIIAVSYVNDVIGYYECTVAGTTGGTQPTWTGDVAIGDTLTDGTVTWTRVGGDSLSGSEALDDSYYERYVAAVNEIKAAAGLTANFEIASATDGCWRDEGVASWFEYAGEDTPLAPISPNVYYHSSVQEAAEDGTVIYRTTMEWGLGPLFRCSENLAEGDMIIVTIAGRQGLPAYQVGDLIELQTTRGQPLEFGGGQTGNDTITWSVRGSVTGAFADYALNLNTLNAYSNGGLGFQITPGAIAFALGDTFSYSIESGQFRWRKNAGAWSAAADITASPVSLSDGLSVTFTAGTAPSWEPGDTWTFTAEALNGVDQLRQPTDGRCRWSTSTTITVAPGSVEPIEGVLIGEHSIPSSATITFQGSDDNFATTPTSQAVTWRSQNIWIPITAERAKYRLVVNQAGSISWLWLGEPMQMALARGGGADLGLWSKRYRISGHAVRAGIGGTVEHSLVGQDAIDDLLEMLTHAAENDDRRFGIVGNEARGEATIVEYAQNELDVDDVFGHQPTDADLSALNVRLELTAIP